MIALVLMLGVGALLMAPGAGAAKKPPNDVVTACKREMQEANRVDARYSELATLLEGQHTALVAFIYEPSPTDADVQVLVKEVRSVENVTPVLLPQIAGAIATHQIQQTKCLKALGLKDADVAPRVPTTG